MILSGAVLGELSDFEAMKIGKQLDKSGFSGSNTCQSAHDGNWIFLRISRQASRVWATRPIRTHTCASSEGSAVL